MTACLRVCMSIYQSLKLKRITYPEIPHNIPELQFPKIPWISRRGPRDFYWYGRIEAYHKKVKVKPETEACADCYFRQEIRKCYLSARETGRGFQQPYVPHINK